MGFEIDVTRNIVRRNKEKFLGMPPEQAKEEVKKIRNYLADQPQDLLIMMATSRNRLLTPALKEELAEKRAKATVKGQEAQTMGGGFGQPGIGGALARMDVAESEQEAELQRLGVATREELPAGSLEMGFAGNQTEGLSMALSNHFGKPVTVFKRGDDFLYLDPEDHIVKRANPGPEGSIGIALPITGDILGTVGMGMVTRGAGALTRVGGETMGSYAGTTGGEFIRRLIGRAMGVNDESLAEMIDKSEDVGRDAALATGAVGSLASLGKGTMNWLKGRIFTVDEAMKYGLSEQQAKAAIDEVNKILREKGLKGEVKGTLFKRTDDPVVGAKEAELRGRIEYSSEFMERDLADQQAIKEVTDSLLKPERTISSAREASEVFGKQIGKRIAKGKQIVSENTDALKKQMDSLGKLKKETVGDPTRKLLMGKREAAKSAEDSMWEQIRLQNGYDPATETYGINISFGDASKQVRENLKRRMKDSPLAVSKGARIFSAGDKSTDLADFNRALSDLRADIRAARNSRSIGDPQVRDLEAAKDALIEDRRTALIRAGRGDLLEKIEDAERASRDFNEIYKRSVVGDLLEKNENGVFRVKGKDFVDRILKGGEEEADQLLRVIGDSPTLMLKWKQGIADAFKREAFTKAGKVNIDDARRFVEVNRPVLKRFFSEENIDEFMKTGNLAEKVEKQTNQLTRIIKNANDKFGRGKITSLDPDSIVKFVTNDTGSFTKPFGREGVQVAKNKIRYMRNMLKDYPGAWRGFVDEFKRNVSKDLYNARTGEIDPNKFARLIKDKEEVIKEIMGDKYYKNLSAVNDVVQILARKPKALAGSESKAIGIQVGRSALFPPLTRRGRAFTAIVLFDNKQGHKAMAQAILNPEEIAKMANLAEQGTLTRSSLELAASLGMISQEEE